MHMKSIVAREFVEKGYSAVRFGIAGGDAAVMTPGTELSRREDIERCTDR
jgi:hypothetical protein